MEPKTQNSSLTVDLMLSFSVFSSKICIYCMLCNLYFYRNWIWTQKGKISACVILRFYRLVFFDPSSSKAAFCFCKTKKKRLLNHRLNVFNINISIIIKGFLKIVKAKDFVTHRLRENFDSKPTR